MSLSKTKERMASSAEGASGFGGTVREWSNRVLAKTDGGCAFYYLAFAFYFINSALGRSAFDPIGFLDTVLKLFAVAFLFLKFVSQKLSLKGWAAALILGAVGLFSWRQAAEGWLFWCALFILCAKGVDINRLAKLTFYLTVAMLVVICASAAFGLIENIAYVRGIETRYCLGFSHPNALGLYLLLMCFSFSAMRFGKNPIPDIILILASDGLNLAVANSRTCVLLSFVQIALLVVFYWVHNEAARKVLRMCFVAAALAVIGASIYFMASYDPSNGLHGALNSVLSGRLRLAHEYYSMQPLTAFGCSFEQFDPIYWEQGLPGAEAKTFVVDNAWCHLILRYGIIPALLFLLGFLGVFFKTVAEKRWDALLFGLVLMTIYGFCETAGIRIECNFLLCSVGTELLYPKDVQSRLRRLVATNDLRSRKK